MGRTICREKLSHQVREFDRWAAGVSTEDLDVIVEWEPDPSEYRGQPSFLGTRDGFKAYNLSSVGVRNDILLPKYYNPQLKSEAQQYEDRCELVTVGELREAGIISLDTGDEIGRLNYGSGSIPFVRTSDLGSYELKRNPKHGIAVNVFEQWAANQDVNAGDILLVRDGIYLVGSSAMIFPQDLPLLYCGGIIKVRCEDTKSLSPPLLYAILSSPFVRRQVRSKQFTRDVIDTLGQRLEEVVLPLPRDNGVRSQIATVVRDLCERRVMLRAALDELVRTLYLVIESP